jgi:16S rRNA (guanine1207-N2)-methyltransferase
MFSNIDKKYDLIISNPPFHQGAGVKQLLEPTKRMIKETCSHLTKNGSLIIVANSFLAYADVLKESFKEVKVIDQNNKYKVYFASNRT